MPTLFVFKNLQRRGSLNIGELRGVCCSVSDASLHDVFLSVFLFVSFFFFSVQSFVRKGVESNGVGDSGFQFSIGCMGVGTQKGLILEQIRLNEMIHDLSSFIQVVGKKCVT